MPNLNNKNMLVLVRGDVFGGAERIALNLVKELGPCFNKIYVGSINNNLKPYLEGTDPEGISLNYDKYSNIIGFIKTYFYLRKFVRDKKIDIIHTHHRIFLPLVKFPIFRKLVHIYTAHNVFYDKKNLFVKPDYAVAVSEAVRDNLTERNGYNPNKVLVIENGIVLNENIKKKVIYQGGRPMIIGYMGRFAEWKGVRFLIEAISLIKDLDVKLIIKGKGPEKNNYEKQILDLGLKNKIIIEDWSDDTESFYSNIDVLVLPSIAREGFGLVIPEAMMHGAVVIGTETGGIKNIIEHNHNGYIVKPESPREIADTLISIYLNGINADILNNSLQSIKKYDIKRAASEYAELFNRLSS